MAATADKPFVLVLDDLHHADATPVLEFLSSLIRLAPAQAGRIDEAPVATASGLAAALSGPATVCTMNTPANPARPA